MNTTKMKTSTAMLDRVELSIYGFSMESITRPEYVSLREAIGRTLFKTAKHFGSNSTYKSIEQDHVSGTGYLKYLPDQHCCTLTLKIKLNPTRLLQHHCFSQALNNKRRSLDGNDNFVPHLLQFMFGRERLQKLSFELLTDKIQSIVNEFTYCIEANVRNYSRIHSPKISFSLLEIYWDLYHQSPYSYIDSIKASWMSHFVNQKCPQFSGLLPSEQLNKSAQYLIGKSRGKELFKVYSKTPMIVRHEAEFRSTRIRSICSTTVLTDNSSNFIESSFVEPLALHAIKVFEGINSPVFDNEDELPNFQSLYELARACGRDVHVFVLILNELKHTRRLATRPVYYSVIPRLLKTGDWKRIGRGIYLPGNDLLLLIDRLFQQPEN